MDGHLQVPDPSYKHKKDKCGIKIRVENAMSVRDLHL